MSTNEVSIPPERVRAAEAVAAVLAPGRRVALTTHVNADGDGVGSEVAMWHLLTARGLRATIATPTPIPERFHFLLPAGADHSERAAREIEAADVVVVLDISDLSRLGDLARAITQSHAVACIDHHVSVGSLPGGPRLVAPEAAATAELVFDFASALQWPLSPDAARALYVGILTDTGGFRFANTTPRVLQVAGALLERGVDPESIYESVYAVALEGRVRLTAEVLGTLVVEPEHGLAWVTCRRTRCSGTAPPPTTWTGSSSIRGPSRGCGSPCCSASSRMARSRSVSARSATWTSPSWRIGSAAGDTARRPGRRSMARSPRRRPRCSRRRGSISTGASVAQERPHEISFGEVPARPHAPRHIASRQAAGDRGVAPTTAM